MELQLHHLVAAGERRLRHVGDPPAGARARAGLGRRPRRGATSGGRLIPGERERDEARLHLLASEQLLRRRQREDRPQDGVGERRPSPGRAVHEQVRQSPALEHPPGQVLHGVERDVGRLRATHHRQCALGARADADAAADAGAEVDGAGERRGGRVGAGLPGGLGDDRDGLHGTRPQAGAAGRAPTVVDRGLEGARLHHRHALLRRAELDAAAGAAAADVVELLLHVVADVHEAVLAGGLEELAPLLPADLPGVAVPDEVAGRRAETQARLHGVVARRAEVGRHVAAEAVGDGQSVGLLHIRGGAVPVEDLRGEVVVDGGLLHERAADERGDPRDLLVERGVVGHVGLVGPGQPLLGQPIAQTHHGKLEEPDHGRREHVRRRARAGVVQVEDQTLAGHRLEPGAQIALARAGPPGEGGEGGGDDRQARGQRGVVGRKEHLQDVSPGPPRGRIPRLDHGDRPALQPLRQILM